MWQQVIILVNDKLIIWQPVPVIDILNRLTSRHKVRLVLYRCLQSAKVLGVNPGYISSLVDIIVDSLVSVWIQASQWWISISLYLILFRIPGMFLSFLQGGTYPELNQSCKRVSLLFSLNVCLKLREKESRQTIFPSMKHLIG